MLGIAGTAATIYGGVVLHRQINKPSIEKGAKNFSEIFRKEVSADDAQKMVNRYKEIFEIKDADNFCTKMFEQVKKDYGYSDVGIKLKIEKMADTSVASKFSKADVAAYSAMDGVLQLNPVHFKDGTMSLGDKQQMFEAIIHELQHAKQSELAYRTNPSKYFEAFQIGRNHRCNNFGDVITRFEETLDSKYALKQFMKENNIKTETEAKTRIKDLIKTLKEKRELLEAGPKINIPKDEVMQTWDNLWGKMGKL